VLKQLNIIH